MATLKEILGAVYRKDYAVLGHLTRHEVNLQDGDGRNALVHAILAANADPAIVKLLIERGADAGAPDGGQRWTPLHFAARDGNVEIVRLLLNAGAEVDPANVFGNTPLLENILGPRADTATIETLLKHGADPYKKNRQGVAPIALARTIGREKIVSMLERKDAS